MSEKSTTKQSLADRSRKGSAPVGPKPKKVKGKAEDWSEFDALDDAGIAEAVAEDPDSAPLGDDDFWKKAKVVLPSPKQAISIRIDEDVLTFFKQRGPGYQSRINAVLRAYKDTHK